MPKKVMRRTAHSETGATKKPWTVLVWIAGDNNLASYGVTDTNDMKKIGSTPDLSIVTQYTLRMPSSTSPRPHAGAS